MNDPFGIAVVGCGTVGSGVVRLLLHNGERLAARAGRPLVLRHVIEREPDKALAAGAPREIVSDDFLKALDDPAVAVVVELVGGTGWSRTAVLQSLGAGKHVVTANKALLAAHAPEIFAAARQAGKAVAFEASVGGGIPIIAALSQSLSANQVQALQAILNGTSNFILTQMSEHSLSYAQALAEAQGRGYAEADPTLDVDGSDAAHKLAILAHLAFGATVPVADIDRHGIAGLSETDIRYAGELGYTIKLLAEAWLDGQALALHVSPVLLRHEKPLAQVRGPYNAIRVIGDYVGDTLFYGKGAGQLPTTSAVVADLLDLAIGRAQITFRNQALWSGQDPGIRLRPTSSVRSRFYLHVVVLDHPGVLAEIARLLAQRHISISSVIQHEALDEHEGLAVPLVIMTHTAETGQFRAAVTEIDRLEALVTPSVFYPVAD